MPARLRIGVIPATSTVARKAVMPAIAASPLLELAATASLSDTSATYGSYDELLSDSSIEAVYLALPNSLHREWTEKAGAAGKHVLCEKPLAACANDAVGMEKACEAAGVVLMEAYMSRFHPRDRALQALVRGGDLGELVAGTAAFTGVLGRPDDHRWHPEMGGGSLLDLGIYCITPLLEAAGADLGDPNAVREAIGRARRAPLGVDSSFSGWLDLGDGVTGAFHCSFEAPERQEVTLVGTEAAAFVERAFTPGTGDVVIRIQERGGNSRELTTEGLDPYQAMVEHFARAVAGEAPLERPASHSIALQRVVDRLRFSAEPAAT